MIDHIKAISAVLVIVGILVGGVVWAHTNFAAKADLERHLENDERRYVLELRKSIRDLRKRVQTDPGDEWLREELQELIDELCEYRPDDKLCR